MFRKRGEIKVLTVSHTYKKEKVNKTLVYLWIEIDIIDKDFLEFLLTNPSYSKGEFTIRIKEKGYKIKMSINSYDSKFDKLFYKTRTFQELIEGTFIEFNCQKNSESFLNEIETVLTRYLKKAYYKYHKKII
ncbi:hypothetical protein [Niallia sp. FSL R7-0271]|uniref:hypothetical protein n=1 Tax=Niallia sp. FSL R7-0271 TaxID=2921678 RepID=UPI0030F6DA78